MRIIRPVYLIQHRKVFDIVADKLEINSHDDWYKHLNKGLQKLIIDNGGHFLKNYYQGSISRALQTIYPEHKWDRFRLLTRNRKLDLPVQRARMDQIAKDLNIRSVDDWYSTYQKNYSKLKELAGGITRSYSGSIARALMVIYPDLPWDQSKFPKPKKYWDNPMNRRQFFDDLAKKLNIVDYSDWLRYRTEDIVRNGGQGVLNKYSSSLFRALSSVFPNENWDMLKRRHYSSNMRMPSKAQMNLFRMVRSILPNEYVETDFRVPGLLIGARSAVEYDIFFPSLSLAFEYQGEVHYFNSTYSTSTSLLHKQYHDERKQKLSSNFGITLITIPFLVELFTK